MLKYEQSELRRINKARQEGLSLRVERSSKISCTDTILGIGIKRSTRSTGGSCFPLVDT